MLVTIKQKPEVKMMTKNDYDFGFSFADENEALGPPQPLQPPAASAEDLKVLQEKIDGMLQQNEAIYKSKLKELENLILPLLYNLMKNPDKAYIKWENRVEVIEKQIEKITSITRS